ncbi:ATP-binding protein [Hyphomicrobium sp.]|uniref:ATP-binding protein n=1 Tax=Hyphomicrobium sp. TaxID=82 RepID=UPI0025C422CF|nr:ATP-binding protein [Hyphomicrobium sp.]MCC7251396.1 histidine kinase [Hyphomicrobium sp.]
MLPLPLSTRRPARPLSLTRSVMLRVALGALLSFLAAAALAVVASDRAGREDARRAAELVQRNLNLQLLRISAGIELPARFPDWDFLAGHVLREGLCLRLLDVEGGIVRASCVGSSMPSYPAWFGALYDAAFSQGEAVEAPLMPSPRFSGRVAAFIEPAALPNQAWLEMSRMLPDIILTVLCVSILAFDAIRRALRPTETVLAGLNRLARGELSYRLPSFRLAELERISEVVNHMAATLEATLADSREFSRRLVTAQEEERQHLARELHDEFGQSLAAINAIAASIETSAERSSPELSSDAHTLSQISMSMMDTLRSTLVRLRPAAIDELGLEESLRSLISGWNGRSRGMTRFEIVGEGRFDGLPDAVMMCLYRIAQEGLTNAARHADARRVTLTLARREQAASDTIELTIEDDGKGYDAAHPSLDGLGLRGMRERVAAFGGRIGISSKNGHGTVLRATIPLAEERCEAA